MCEPRIYVACLASYNSGYLHGVWIDATDRLDDIQEQVNDMLAQSPVEDAEEHAVHDYEGFGGYAPGEYESFATIHEVAWFIRDYPSLAGDLLNQFNGNVEEARTAMDDQYHGCYRSLADFAQDLTEDTTQIPESLKFYIDYDRMGRDMEMSGDIFTIETGFEKVHIFWTH